MDDDAIESGMSGANTPVSGRSTPALTKRKFGAVSTPTQSRSESVLKEALNALEKCQDDAQIFGDFIASSIRELETVDKQQALKRALNRALLDFQDAQHRTSYQPPYQAPYQQPYQQPYQGSSYTSPNQTLGPSNSQLPSFANNDALSDALSSQTYQNL